MAEAISSSPGAETNLHDRTDGLRSMLLAMKEDGDDQEEDNGELEDHLLIEREEAKEEEYDYFLDAHKDENILQNKGYHLVDQADLDEDEKAKKLDAEEEEEEDLESLQNMLEGLKESIKKDDEEQHNK